MGLVELPVGVYFFRGFLSLPFLVVVVGDFFVVDADHAFSVGFLCAGAVVEGACDDDFTIDDDKLMVSYACAVVDVKFINPGVDFGYL